LLPRFWFWLDDPAAKSARVASKTPLSSDNKGRDSRLISKIQQLTAKKFAPK